MKREIADQPDVLRRAICAVDSFLGERDLTLPAGGRIHLVGCGDMDFCARGAAALYRRVARGARATDVVAHSSMEMRWDAADLSSRDVVIAASFSGRTPRTVEAALLAKSAGARVIGVTGNTDSTFAERLDEILLLRTGPADELNRHAYGGYHANVPQTKTYTAALMTELLLLAHLTGNPGGWRADLEKIPGLVEFQISSMAPHIDDWVKAALPGWDSVVILGSGPWRPAAAFGAAKFLEMSIPSRHQCIEEFNHLELFLTGAESLVVFLCPDRESWERASELIGPYEKLGSRRLAFVAGAALEARPLASNVPGADVIALPHGSVPARFFSGAVALQLLAAAVGPALGRDIDRWVGGVRTGLIEDLSQITIRGSLIRGE